MEPKKIAIACIAVLAVIAAVIIVPSLMPDAYRGNDSCYIPQDVLEENAPQIAFCKSFSTCESCLAASGPALKEGEMCSATVHYAGDSYNTGFDRENTYYKCPEQESKDAFTECKYSIPCAT